MTIRYNLVMELPHFNLKIDETSALLKQFSFIMDSFGFYEFCESQTKTFISPNYAMLIINNGRLKIAVNNIENIVAKNDIVIVTLHKQCKITPLKENSSFYYFDFSLPNPENYQEFEKLLRFEYKFVYKNLITDWQLANLAHLNQTVAINYPGTYLLVESTLLRILIVIIKYSNEHYIPIIPNNDNAKNNLLNACLEYIDDHIHQPIKIKDMANELEYSENYIYKIFKELINMSCQDYILTIKLYNALKDLLTTDENISDIAFNNGFNSLYHFSKVFKQKYGYAPSNLRKIKNK